MLSQILQNPHMYEHELRDVDREGNDVMLTLMEYASRIVEDNYWGGIYIFIVVHIAVQRHHDNNEIT